MVNGMTLKDHYKLQETVETAVATFAPSDAALAQIPRVVADIYATAFADVGSDTDANIIHHTVETAVADSVAATLDDYALAHCMGRILDAFEELAHHIEYAATDAIAAGIEAGDIPIDTPKKKG